MKIESMDTGRIHRVFISGEERAYIRIVPDVNPFNLILWYHSTETGFDLLFDEEIDELEEEFQIHKGH